MHNEISVKQKTRDNLALTYMHTGLLILCIPITQLYLSKKSYIVMPEITTDGSSKWLYNNNKLIFILTTRQSCITDSTLLHPSIHQTNVLTANSNSHPQPPYY